MKPTDIIGRQPTRARTQSGNVKKRPVRERSMADIKNACTAWHNRPENAKRFLVEFGRW